MQYLHTCGLGKPKGAETCQVLYNAKGLQQDDMGREEAGQLGNTMTDFTYKGFEIQVIDVGGIAVFENPEDLGAVKHGEHRGVRPASMWQWEQFSTLLQLEQVTSVAFHQLDFGTDYLKPTRLHQLACFPKGGPPGHISPR